jgi:hypothetical protein
MEKMREREATYDAAAEDIKPLGNSCQILILETAMRPDLM